MMNGSKICGAWAVFKRCGQARQPGLVSPSPALSPGERALARRWKIRGCGCSPFPNLRFEPHDNEADRITKPGEFLLSSGGWGEEQANPAPAHDDFGTVNLRSPGRAAFPNLIMKQRADV
jgi:hypothetical protein